PISPTRALRDAGVGSDLQPLARNAAITRSSGQARAPQPRARARYLPALRSSRTEGPLRPVESTAPLCEGGYRERCQARAELKPTVLSGPQTHPRTPRPRDRAARGNPAVATS